MKTLIITLVSLALSASAGLFASDVRNDRFSLVIGRYVVKHDTDVRGQSADIPFLGALVDLEDDLGLDERETVWRADGHFRFNHRHRVGFSASIFSREEEETLIDTEIVLGEEVFQINSLVKTDFDLALGALNYYYTFTSTPKVEVSLLAGFALLGWDLDLTAAGMGGTGGTTKEVKSDGRIPLPVLGLQNDMIINKWFGIEFQFRYFDASYDIYSGNVNDFFVWFKTYPHKNVGIAVGYVYYGINMEVEEENFTFEIDVRASGGEFSLIFNWGRTPGKLTGG